MYKIIYKNIEIQAETLDEVIELATRLGEPEGNGQPAKRSKDQEAGQEASTHLETEQGDSLVDRTMALVAQGLKPKEIAQKLGVSVARVYSMKCYAKKKIAAGKD
jgi:DNA-directed RNA polymerase specialized sigma24 family protein